MEIYLPIKINPEDIACKDCTLNKLQQLQWKHPNWLSNSLEWFDHPLHRSYNRIPIRE